MQDDKRLRIHPELLQRARQFRRPMTPMEQRLYPYLRDRKCGGFKWRRQAVLGPFIADFYCAEARLLLEIDGESHNATVERDAARDEWFALHGYQTLRIPNADVRDHLESVLQTIVQTCIARTA